MEFNNKNSKSGCPCAGCAERNEDCHSVCTKYADWHSEQAARKIAILVDRKKRNDCCRAAVKEKVKYRGKRESK